MGEITIRQATKSDIEAVHGLLRELSEYLDAEIDLQLDGMKRLFDLMVREPARYRNLIAVVEGEIAGFISVVYNLTLFHRKGTALINELVVSAKHRNVGVGKALIQEVLRISKEEGWDEVQVGAKKTNSSAIGFYRKMGFDREYILLVKEFDSECEA